MMASCLLLPPQCVRFEMEVRLQLVFLLLLFSLSLSVSLHANVLLAELWLSSGCASFNDVYV